MNIYGSCRIKPNKVELINMAYEKVGIIEGYCLLTAFLKPLRKKNNFNLQRICSLDLNQCEINLINCVENYKSNSHKTRDFIKYWNLYEEKELFSRNARFFADAYKKANLSTNLDSNYLERGENCLTFQTVH